MPYHETLRNNDNEKVLAIYVNKEKKDFPIQIIEIDREADYYTCVVNMTFDELSEITKKAAEELGRLINIDFQKAENNNVGISENVKTSWKVEGESCPFCKPGTDLKMLDLAKINHDYFNWSGFRVVCNCCHLNGSTKPTPEEALAEWNDSSKKRKAIYGL